MFRILTKIHLQGTYYTPPLSSMFSNKNISRSTRSLKIQYHSPVPGILLLRPSERAFLSNSGWQNRKERPNRTTKNGDMTKTATRSLSE